MAGQGLYIILEGKEMTFNFDVREFADSRIHRHSDKEGLLRESYDPALDNKWRDVSSLASKVAYRLNKLVLQSGMSAEHFQTCTTIEVQPGNTLPSTSRPGEKFMGSHRILSHIWQQHCCMLSLKNSLLKGIASSRHTGWTTIRFGKG